MDPLRCLRDFYKNKREQEVKFSDDNARISFGEEYEFSSATSTRFKSSIGAAYQLGTLLFYMQHRHLNSAMYIQKATAAVVEKVSRSDQQV